MHFRTALDADPIGRCYGRTLVLRLKYELGVAFAMLSAGTGLLWLWSIGLSYKVVVVAELVCLLFAAGGLFKDGALTTHRQGIAPICWGHSNCSSTKTGRRNTTS